jgi:hypothetical protein
MLAVHPVVQFSAADREGRGDQVTRFQGAGLFQRQHAVAEHLRPHLEVMPLAERRQDGIGDRADAELKRRAVVDERRDPVADSRAGAGDRARRR